MVEGAALEMLCTEMYLGFESLTLRQRRHKLCITCDDFFVKNHPALTPLFLLFPKKSVDFSGARYLVNNRIFRTFLFCPFAQNRLKTMERTARFLERTRRFSAFWRIRTVKISSFRHRLKFRSTCCRNSTIREAPFR